MLSRCVPKTRDPVTPPRRHACPCMDRMLSRWLCTGDARLGYPRKHGTLGQQRLHRTTRALPWAENSHAFGVKSILAPSWFPSVHAAGVRRARVHQAVLAFVPDLSIGA